jgi:hypothetical protein
MSFAAEEWAWNQPVKHGSKIVLVFLARMANAEGKCWPTVGYLCRFTGLTDKAVRTALIALDKEGLISRDTREGASSVYHINSPAEETPVEITEGDKSEPRQKTTSPPVIITANPGKNGALPPVKITDKSKENLKLTSTEPVPPYNPPKRGKAPKEPTRATEVPEDWWPDAKGIEMARSLGIDHEAEVPRFIANHRAKGNKFLRLGQAWGTWCRSPYAKIMLPGHSTGPPRNGHVTVADALAAIAPRPLSNPPTIDPLGNLLL